MTLIELASAIEAMKAALEAAFAVTAAIDDAALARSSAVYVRDLKDTLASCERALAYRLELGEIE